ncbi:MAG: DUF4369 domain-containing protein [Dysgonomonas sp.]
MSKIKHYILGLASLLFLTFISFSCEDNSSHFKLKGTLKNVEGEYFYATREIQDSVIIDTILIDKDGKFSFEGNIDTLSVIRLFFNENTKSTYFFADKGWDIKIDGDALYPDLIEIKGGDINDDLTAFKKENKDLLKKRAEILKVAEKKVISNDNIADKDYVVELKNINFELSNIAAEYVKANPTKIASVMLINSFFKNESSIPRLDENLALLRGKAATFSMTGELKQFVSKVKQIQIGAVAPNFTSKNTKGKTVNLVDFRGKYVLLSFVSTTCEMCNAGRKDAIRTYNELKKEKKNIEFITVIIDTEQLEITKEIKDSIKWDLLPEEGSWAAKTINQYYVRELPYNILISPTGVILEKDFPIEALPQKLHNIESNK